jgi:hypothetical protein
VGPDGEDVAKHPGTPPGARSGACRAHRRPGGHRGEVGDGTDDARRPRKRTGAPRTLLIGAEKKKVVLASGDHRRCVGGEHLRRGNEVTVGGEEPKREEEREEVEETRHDTENLEEGSMAMGRW